MSHPSHAAEIATDSAAKAEDSPKPPVSFTLDSVGHCILRLEGFLQVSDGRNFPSGEYAKVEGSSITDGVEAPECLVEVRRWERWLGATGVWRP